jgi:hypothetical protein
MFGDERPKANKVYPTSMMPTEVAVVGDADTAPSGSEGAPIHITKQPAYHKAWRLATWPLRALDFDDVDMEVRFHSRLV